MKKIKIMLLSCLIMLYTVAGVQAANIDMYINGNYVVRNLEAFGEYDMLPVLDIACELGYSCIFDGATAVLYNDWNSYSFTAGSAKVTDRRGNIYGLDVVPQLINGGLYVPAKFFEDIGMTYTWDDVTSTLFINSDATYKWLISTSEYQYGKKLKQTQDTIQGWWWHYYSDGGLYYFSENVCFAADGSYYYRTWREKRYGTYTVIAPNVVKVYYDSYYDGPTDDYHIGGNYEYDGSYTEFYEVTGFYIKGGQYSSYFNSVNGYCYPGER